MTIAELQDAIDIKKKEKENLENSIGELKERLSGLRIAADVAEALPSIITGKDMKLKELCTAFIAGRDAPATDANAIRERIINVLIEISEGGIVPEHYSSHDRFISGTHYDRLMQLEKDRGKIAKENSELQEIQNLYGKDVGSYLHDYITGRITADSQGYRVIREIAEETFRKKVETMFDARFIGEIARNSDESSPLFMVVPDAASGAAVVGSVTIKDLVAAVNAGSGSIELDTAKGKVPIDTCTAVMQLFGMYMEFSLLEKLRNEWRESFMNARGTNSAPRYGGLVGRDEGGERRENG